MLPQSQSERLAPNPPAPLWLRTGFWICIVIAVAVVIRRIATLAFPSPNPPPQVAGLDDAFASHAALTLAHILPALAFVLVAPFVVFRRTQRPWPERLIYPLGLITGISAYAMSAYAVGGWTERSAVFFFDTLFLVSLGLSYRHRARGQSDLQRRWLLRSIAVLLGIATTRPVMGVFFATSRISHLTFHQFFGIAFWVGFSLNTLIFELWLRSRDHRLHAREIAQSHA